MEDVALTTFSSVIQDSPVHKSTARLFSRDGDKIVYMDIPGWPADVVRINGHEYVFVGRHILVSNGYLFFGKLVNLATGEISAEEFQFRGDQQPIISPDKKLYWVSQDWLDGYSGDYMRSSVVHAIYNSDGKRLGAVIGPMDVSFLDDNTVGGVDADLSRQHECQYQITLNLKTGKTESKQFPCKFDDLGE